MSDQPQHSEERRIISMSEVSDDFLRAWVDAGVLTAAEYHAEMQRRSVEDVQRVAARGGGSILDIEVPATVSSNV